MTNRPTRSASRKILPLFCAVSLAAVAGAGKAEDRPTEGDLFGGSTEAPTPPPSAPPSAPIAPPVAAPERALEAEPDAEKRLLGVLSRTDNPLQLGGVLYLRSNLSAREHTPPSQWSFSAPNLVDLYLDARPSDRVRGFVLGRMLYDAAQGATTSNSVSGLTLSSASSSTSSNPRALLDQLWLRFDVEHAAFLTIGRQHVKWGVGHFWNPTDYLHAVRRDPLSTFDQRTGTFMARVHLPWEKRGWNFYGMLIFESLVTQGSSLLTSSEAGQNAEGTTSTASSQADDTLGRLGAGARAEIVLGGWELGLDAVAQRGIRPRFGIDLSGGVGEVDLHGELALRTSSDVPLFRGTYASQGGGVGFSTYEPSGIRPMVVAGADWSHKYSDEDSFTLGVEYFYNSNGYSDGALYPALLLESAYTPYYLGRHYAGAYLSLPKPGAWDLHTFTLSILGNLSDQSGLARLDWSMTLLTYLTLEAYAQGHFGTNGGEFRLGLDTPALSAANIPALFLGAPIADLGLNVKMQF